MKKNIQFLVFLALLAAVSGYLMSQMSWIGRVGINLMHKEYKFLKVWWQGAALIYGLYLVFFSLHAIIQKLLHIGIARLLHGLFFIIAAGGFYITSQDFSDDFSHSLLKQRFHIGAYLFWVGWMCICIFYITKKSKKVKPMITDTNNTAAVNQ